MPDLTPERLDLIRSSCRRSVATSDKYPLITMDAADVLALLDAAAERDALAAAVERVRALHWIDDDDDSGKWCGYCQSDFDAAQADEWYPCATIRALDESEADK